MAEDAAILSHPSKPKSPQISNNPITKFYSSKFVYKAALVTVFLVLLPLSPSIAPQFINQTLHLHARSWELLQLIFVGIAVSYGLFSKKNDETEKDNNSNAQSYVSKLLQVSSSVFEDESIIEQNIKVDQTLNSQQYYYRGQPVVVVAAQQSLLQPVVEKGIGACEFTQKPLLLPVRSLKQPSEGDVAVLRSPIPWRSRPSASAANLSDPPPISEHDGDVAPPPAPPPRKPPLLSKSNSSTFTVSPEKKVLRRSVTGVPKEESSLVEKVMMMESSEEDSEEEEENNNNNNSVDDVGPDVDKKADEFIAKFREQIRLQRIESIRRSTAQRAGKV